MSSFFPTAFDKSSKLVNSGYATLQLQIVVVHKCPKRIKYYVIVRYVLHTFTFSLATTKRNGRVCGRFISGGVTLPISTPAASLTILVIYCIIACRYV